MIANFSDASVFSGLHRPKAKWSADEDQVLLGLIQERGAHHWNQIAESVPGRTGKQCRERWLSKLSPDCTAVSWTAEEDDILISCQQAHGNQWSTFRTQLPNRSLVQIKNRWVSLTRRGLVPRPELAFRAPHPQLAEQCTRETALLECAFGAGVYEPMPFDDSFFPFDAGMWCF
jgi:hypothetical protein